MHELIWRYILGLKLSEDCYRYGGENHATDAILAKAAALYGGAVRNVEKEHEDFSSFLTSQVSIAICLDFLHMNREFGMFQLFIH